eukprot:m.86113 g.86113  ORF g.86113 m.86113 type:complete len:1096 (+) comp36490_c0_seq3:38-3325(+)
MAWPYLIVYSLSLFIVGVIAVTWDLNGPNVDGGEYTTEFVVGGVSVLLAANGSFQSNNTLFSGNCFTLSDNQNSSHADLAHFILLPGDTPIEVKSFHNQLRLSNFTDEQSMLDYVQLLRFSCNETKCSKAGVKVFHFRSCGNGRGSGIPLGESRVWITKRPVVSIAGHPVTFVEQKSPVRMLGDYSNVSFEANRWMGVHSLEILLENAVDGKKEFLNFSNISSGNANVSAKSCNHHLIITLLSYGSEKEAVGILKNILYENIAEEPNASRRNVRISVNNGKLESLPVRFFINIQLENDNRLTISQMPRVMYWNSTASDVVIKLAQNASLGRVNPQDVFPVYRGRVASNYTDDSWVSDPFTNLTCHSSRDAYTKLANCAKSRAVDMMPLMGLASVKINTSKGISYVEFNVPNDFVIFPSTGFPPHFPAALTHWTFSLWLKFSSADQYLHMSMSNGSSAIFSMKIFYDRVDLNYTATAGSSVNAVFYLASPQAINAWQNVILTGNAIAVSLLVNGQFIESGTPSHLQGMSYAKGNIKLSAFTGNGSVAVSGFAALAQAIGVLEAVCVTGCEEQILINFTKLSSIAINELKPLIVEGGRAILTSGPASLASYTSLLRSLEYANFAANPNPSPRQIDFIISDTKYSASHSMRLIHVCSPSEWCGKLSENIQCFFVAERSAACLCPLAGHQYDNVSMQCLPLLDCGIVNGNCPNRSRCRQIRPTNRSCECESGFEMNSDMECVDVDDCLTGPCKNGGTCLDGNSSYNCLCPPKFTGDLCETPTNSCYGDPCRNNGTCFSNGSSFSCICPSGYGGRDCNDSVHCQELKCPKNQSCVENAIGGGQRNVCRCIGGETCSGTDPPNLGADWSTGKIIAVAICGGAFIIICICIIARVIAVKRKMANVLKVEGKQSVVISSRQRFRYSQYKIENSEKNLKSKASYSFVNKKETQLHNHNDLKKDFRPAVRRLSMAFADVGLAAAAAAAAAAATGGGEKGTQSIFSKSRQLGEFNVYGLYRQRANSGGQSIYSIDPEFASKEDLMMPGVSEDEDGIDHLPGDGEENESNASLSSFELPAGMGNSDPGLMREGLAKGALLTLNPDDS